MAVYYVWSGATGTGSGATWANAFITLTLAFATEVAGDTLYVAHDHAESSASALTLTSSGTIAVPTKVVCVNRAGTVPPVSADRRATATVSTTGATNISLAGLATHYDGIIFNCGNGVTSAASMIVGTAANAWMRFDNCSFRLNVVPGAASTIYLGGSSGGLGGSHFELNNTTMSFGGTSNKVSICGTVKWRNTPSALLGTIPTTSPLFVAFAQQGGSLECIGVDLSAAGSGKTIVGDTNTQSFAYKFIDCKLDNAATKVSAMATPGNMTVDFIRSSATGNIAVYSQRNTGTLIEETTIVRTSGGATDGVTPISWKVVTTANALFSRPFECPPIAIWIDTTGSAKTATIECIGAAIGTDQEVWVDLEYLGDASSPQGSFVNDGKADLLATAANQTSSSETWGGSTAAFKLAVTFTAQQKGWIYARVKVGKASSTFYIDPLVTLT